MPPVYPGAPGFLPMAAYAPAMFPVRDTRSYLPAIRGQGPNDWATRMSADISAGQGNSYLNPESAALVSGGSTPSATSSSIPPLLSAPTQSTVASPASAAPAATSMVGGKMAASQPTMTSTSTGGTISSPMMKIPESQSITGIGAIDSVLNNIAGQFLKPEMPGTMGTIGSLLNAYNTFQGGSPWGGKAPETFVAGGNQYALKPDSQSSDILGTGGNLGMGFLAGGPYGMGLTGGAGLISNMMDDQRGVQGATSGAMQGASAGFALTGGNPIGAAVGAVVGGLLGGFVTSSGKDEDQQRRDAVKDKLRSAGIVTENWGLPLYGGGEYELRDNPEYWTAQQYQGRADLEEIQNMARVAAFGMVGGQDPMLLDTYTGWLTNAAMQNSSNANEARNHILTWIQKLGISPQDMLRAFEAWGGSNYLPQLQAGYQSLLKEADERYYNMNSAAPTGPTPIQSNLTGKGLLNRPDNVGRPTPAPDATTPAYLPNSEMSELRNPRAIPTEALDIRNLLQQNENKVAGPMSAPWAVPNIQQYLQTMLAKTVPQTTAGWIKLPGLENRG